jgi:1-deoxyxylulose-5-phosphate synthase
MTQRPEPYAPLLSGGTFDVLEPLAAFGSERAMSMAAVALAWLLADDRVTQIVLGPGRPEHLDPLREALERPLHADERAELGSMFG